MPSPNLTMKFYNLISTEILLGVHFFLPSAQLIPHHVNYSTILPY